MASINSQLLVRNDTEINGVNLEKHMTTKLYDLDSGNENTLDSFTSVIEEITKKHSAAAAEKWYGGLKEELPVSKESKKTVSLLVNKKMKASILLESTSLAPSPSVLFSGQNFQRKYKEELLSAFTKVDDAHMVDMLMSLSTVYQSLMISETPVQLRSAKYKRKLNEIIYVLNWVFRVHGDLLGSINQMVFDEMDGKDTKAVTDVKSDNELEPVGDVFEH